MRERETFAQYARRLDVAMRLVAYDNYVIYVENHPQASSHVAALALQAIARATVRARR